MNKDLHNQIVLKLQSGDLQHAERLCFQNLKDIPGDARTHYFLGAIYHQSGKLELAVKHLKTAVDQQPDESEYQLALGNMLLGLGKFSEAEEVLDKCVARRPELARTYHSLGASCVQSGKNSKAVKAFTRAVELEPDSFTAYAGLAVALRNQGKHEEAVTHLNRAISLNAGFIEGHAELGLTFSQRGEYEKSVQAFRKAISLYPDSALFHYNLGNVLRKQGKYGEAKNEYENAISLNPDYADARNNLGLALYKLGDTDAALKEYDKVLAIAPGNSNALSNLAGIYKDRNDYGTAIGYYRKAISNNPEASDIFSNMLLTMNYIPGLDPEELYSEHIRFSEKFEKPLTARLPEHSYDPVFDRKLRIGYVSADFFNHSMAFFIEPVLENHDHNRFDIFCYENRNSDGDKARKSYKCVDHWRTIGEMSDQQVVQLIARDQIDLLVDLSGHTANNRLLVFARKPAPVQITWLGYPNTTGLSAMDYRLTDNIADPAGRKDQLYTEELIRLPRCFSCFRPNRVSPAVKGLPARANNFVTFGSFNTLAKQPPRVLALWARILKTVPESRLYLKTREFMHESVCENVRGFFRGQGIEPERLILHGKDKDTRIHLDRYNEIDIALDPFPYCGTTTNCDALWMGVPVITLKGDAHVSRVTSSQLETIGLSELIALTQDDYLKIALQLSGNLDYLAEMRTSLRERMAASPLRDEAQFTRNLEDTYQSMWKTWCKSKISRKNKTAHPEYP